MSLPRSLVLAAGGWKLAAPYSPCSRWYFMR